MIGQETPSLRETTPVWAKIGLLSFGGPAAQIALMHREIVEDRDWLSEQKFLNAVSFCMMLPGPEAMQIATYAGWRLNGVLGGIIAGGLFVLPGALVIGVLAALYTVFGQVPFVQTAFLGVQAAVIAIVLKALWGIMGRALNGPLHWVLAGFGFVALFAFDLPFPLVIAIAALAGAILNPSADKPPESVARQPRGTAMVLAWAGLWAAPLLGLWLFDPNGLLLQIGLFFSKLAVVTFGGAYAVLAYMAQEVVTGFGWLSADQMLDGLGLAETTPGPLILVTEFVGFLAGAGQGGLGFGVLAAVLTLWVTFIPCFLWIFAAAPYVEWITGQPRLNGALRGITAAVVGVIANLSIWFALHVFFGSVTRLDKGALTVWVPDVATLNPGAVMLAVLSGLALFRLNWPLLAVLGASALVALALHGVGVAL